jgi:DNA-binding CsgD family transcriptional regulator
MSKSYTPSYIEYLQKIPACEEVDFNDLNYYLKERPFDKDYFNLGSCIFYTFDYTKKQYGYLAGNLRNILGYYEEDFLEGGADFFRHIYQEDDLKIFSENIFRQNISFLSQVAPQLHSHYRISFTYRLKRRDGLYTILLQQNSFLKTDAQGNPLLSFGIVTDISSFKKDSKISHHIELPDMQGVYHPVLTNYHFPDEQQSLLTKREAEILRWIIEGLSSHEIANKLHLSTHTIRTHRKNLMEKSNAKNAAELIKYAIQSGVI